MMRRLPELARSVPKRPTAIGGAAGGSSLLLGGGVVGAVVASAAVGAIYFLERARKTRAGWTRG